MNEKILSRFAIRERFNRALELDTPFGNRILAHDAALRQEIADLRELATTASSELWNYTAHLEYSRLRDVTKIVKKIDAKLAEPAP